MKNKWSLPLPLPLLVMMTLLISAFTIGLAITIHYSYLQPLSHQHVDTCIVYNCTVDINDPYECECYSYWTCSTCYTFSYDYILNLNGTNYTNYFTSDTIDTQFCTTETYVICYYYDNDIRNSLNVLRYVPSDVIVAMSLLSISLFASLLFCCVIVFMGFEY